MSPILVRPVREQFEHDRVIRLLQARYKRKYDVVINPGSEQNASVTSGELAVYPDLVLFSLERGRRLQGTIEVETGESVNTLEAMAEWGPFSRLRAPFVLYVPPNSLDAARRLCAEYHVIASEIWTYHTAADQIRFTMVDQAPESSQSRGKGPARLEDPDIDVPAAATKPVAVRASVATPAKVASAKVASAKVASAKVASVKVARKVAPVKKAAPARKAAPAKRATPARKATGRKAAPPKKAAKPVKAAKAAKKAARRR